MGKRKLTRMGKGYRQAYLDGGFHESLADGAEGHWVDDAGPWWVVVDLATGVAFTRFGGAAGELEALLAEGVVP